MYNLTSNSSSACKKYFHFDPLYDDEIYDEMAKITHKIKGGREMLKLTIFQFSVRPVR